VSRHDDVREFLASQSPAWLAELQSAASGRDDVETVRRELDHAIFVSGFVDEDEVGTYVAGADRALETLTGLIGSGHAAEAAKLAQHALSLTHESAESVNYECELEEGSTPGSARSSSAPGGTSRRWGGHVEG